MSRFRFCLNASTIATTPILRQLEVAKEAGYEAIELWHDHIDAYLATGGTLRELCRAVENSGLIIPTTIYLAGWFQPAGPEHDKALDEVKRRLEQAAAVGAKFAIAGPPMGKADRATGAAHYAELLEIGKMFGVRPAFEYLGFVEDINTIDDAIDIIQRSGQPDATVVVDPFHCHRGGGSMESISKLKAEQIAISHFNDCPVTPPANQHTIRIASFQEMAWLICDDIASYSTRLATRAFCHSSCSGTISKHSTRFRSQSWAWRKCGPWRNESESERACRSTFVAFAEQLLSFRFLRFSKTKSVPKILSNAH